MSQPIVLDLETKKTFQEVGGQHADKLGVSVVGVYSYEDDAFYTFVEKEFDRLFRLLERSSAIIGFNINSFDLPVLQPYYVGKLTKFRTFDIMDEVKSALGRRLALNDLATATLNVKKSGHGLMAINYYHEGRWDELKKYCLDDVRITRDLFEYGKKHNTIYYPGTHGRQSFSVRWNTLDLNGHAETESINLTLPI